MCPGLLHFTLLIIVLLDNKYYSQIHAVVMVSPLGLALTKILLCYYESNWLKDCPKDFKPVHYKRYVDSIVLFNQNMCNFFLNI